MFLRVLGNVSLCCLKLCFLYKKVCSCDSYLRDLHRLDIEFWTYTENQNSYNFKHSGTVFFHFPGKKCWIHDHFVANRQTNIMNFFSQNLPLTQYQDIWQHPGIGLDLKFDNRKDTDIPDIESFPISLNGETNTQHFLQDGGGGWVWNQGYTIICPDAHR